MRKAWAFLVWLFSFWTWKDFFVRSLRRWPPFYPAASGETAGTEQLISQEGPPESEWARFLSALPEDERLCTGFRIEGDTLFEMRFGPNRKDYRADTQAGYREFLGAVASSKAVFYEEMGIRLEGDDSLKHMEAFANALRQSGNAFRKLEMEYWEGSAIAFTKCVSSALLGNDAIQELHLCYIGENENRKMGKEEAAELMAIVALPHFLRILKCFGINRYDLDDEGMEQLMKPFYCPDSALENLTISYISSDAQLEHISDLLAASTSLKTLYLDTQEPSKKWNKCTRGYTNIASALCSNRSLQDLYCPGLSSTELTALLDPLMPNTSNLQPNTTLTNPIPPSPICSYGEHWEGKRGLRS